MASKMNEQMIAKICGIVFIVVPVINVVTAFILTPPSASFQMSAANALTLWLLPMISTLVGIMIYSMRKKGFFLLSAYVIFILIYNSLGAGIAISRNWLSFYNFITILALLVVFYVYKDILFSKSERGFFQELDPRHPMIFSVEGGKIHGETEDISQSGCQLKTTESLAIDQEIDLKICLKGRVVRVIDDGHEKKYGIQFIRPDMLA